MQSRIEVDEGEVLTLFGREGFCRKTHAGHPIQLFVRATSGRFAPDEKVGCSATPLPAPRQAP